VRTRRDRWSAQTPPDAIRHCNAGQPERGRDDGAGLPCRRSAICNVIAAIVMAVASSQRARSNRGGDEGERRQDGSRSAWERFLRFPTFAADQRKVRTSQSSGKNERSRAVFKYSTPEEPPVPGLLPMIRSTVFMWRNRHCWNQSSTSTKFLGEFVQIKVVLRFAINRKPYIAHQWVRQVGLTKIAIKHLFWHRMAATGEKVQRFIV
jgi:hypothetical protein